MKIKTSFNKIKEQKTILDIRRRINRANKDIVNKANNYYDVNKNIFVFETDWLGLEEATSERFITSPGIVDRTRFVNWTFNLGFIPDIWIPFINFNIMYRSPSNPLNEDFKTFYIYQEESKVSRMTNLTIISTISIFQFGSSEINLDDVEAKAIITIENPHNFI